MSNAYDKNLTASANCGFEYAVELLLPQVFQTISAKLRQQMAWSLTDIQNRQYASAYLLSRRQIAVHHELRDKYAECE